MSDEENKNNNQNTFCANHSECKRYLLIAVSAFLGSFLASYFLIHQTMMFMMHKHHQKMYNEYKIERDVDKSFKKFDRDFEKLNNFADKEYDKIKRKVSAIQTNQYEDSYIIVVDLSQFDNNEKNIKFNIKNNIATVSGETKNNKFDSDGSYYFMESFAIPEKVDTNKIKKEKIYNKYIITLPIEY